MFGTCDEKVVCADQVRQESMHIPRDAFTLSQCALHVQHHLSYLIFSHHLFIVQVTGGLTLFVTEQKISREQG